MLKKSIKDLSNSLKLYQVWIFQAYHELSAKYKRTFLGSLWIAGSMVSTSLSLSIVFGGIFGQSLKDVLPYIMGGILAFNLVGMIFTEAAEIFVGASGVIRNHAYPFSYYVFESIAKAFMVFLHNIIIYYISVAILGAAVIPHWSLIIGIVAVLVCLFFWCTIVAMFSARYRDMRYMMPYLAQLMMFLTPIFWRVDQMHNGREIIAYVNPFYGLVEIIRSPLNGTMAPAICWYQVLAFTIIGMLIWLVSFAKYRRRIPFWV